MAGRSGTECPAHSANGCTKFLSLTVTNFWNLSRLPVRSSCCASCFLRCHAAWDLHFLDRLEQTAIVGTMPMTAKLRRIVTLIRRWSPGMLLTGATFLSPLHPVGAHAEIYQYIGPNGTISL